VVQSASARRDRCEPRSCPALPARRDGCLHHNVLQRCRSGLRGQDHPARVRDEPHRRSTTPFSGWSMSTCAIDSWSSWPCWTSRPPGNGCHAAAMVITSLQYGRSGTCHIHARD